MFTVRVWYLFVLNEFSKELIDLTCGVNSLCTSAPILFINTPEEGECYEEEVQPHRKTDCKPMIYIYNVVCDIDWHCYKQREGVIKVCVLADVLLCILFLNRKITLTLIMAGWLTDCRSSVDFFAYYQK